ncbi:endu-1 [Pristionchus pacificus]|uniref:Poly(U)-specific endoribonuclease n=1 Tax=Pristionchus pacificus TaxID=54126 RepID=A0A2A6B4R4_PRIPA|nr:endu-1 [Pristionchus pacificus]|eukprot:PDM60870.1 hypothetical protein PRIPAC_54676 [Pristionchus pacificus]
MRIASERLNIEERNQCQWIVWMLGGASIVLLLSIYTVYGQYEKIPAFQISNSDLISIANELRSLDENAAKPGQIRLNYQGHTSTRDASDNAADRLFQTVDSSLLRKPSYEQFIALMNNFNRNTGETEPLDKNEKSTFLTTVIESKPMQRLYNFLKSKGHPFATDPVTWRYWMAQLWFVNYSRARGRADTSGFEHIFIGEASRDLLMDFHLTYHVKNDEISGMHNWLRFYTLERDPRANFDYKGFVVKRFNMMAAVKFTWQREMKRSGSMLIGTSPEFDMSLYTLCFLSRRGRDTCDVEVNGCPLSITSYDLVQNRKVFIGSIFPSAGRITDSCRRNNS